MKLFFSVLIFSFQLFANHDHDERKKAQDFGRETLLPFVQRDDFKKACRKANKERAKWAPYTEDWKEITTGKVASLKDSYTKAEYRYTILKDKDFRSRMTSHHCAKNLVDFQKQHPQISEIFVTDKNGGNIFATHETTDWFQGDEPKFIDAFNSKSIMVGAHTQDSSTKFHGSHVSIPLIEDNEVICMAIFFVQTIEDKYQH